MKYFTMTEMYGSATAKAKGIDNTPGTQVRENLAALVENVLDPLRAAYKKPIKVNCGYRCPGLNKAVGGVATSQHLTGQAADITGGSAEENKKLFNLILMLLPFDQVIYEFGGQWVHVSYSTRNRHQALMSYKQNGVTKYAKYAENNNSQVAK